MSERRRYSVVRDPVHGDIYLSAEEIALIDTAPMQRLRGVRQLGSAFLVYPGALHTRFEHSLGTLHLVSRLVRAINQNRSLRPRDLLGIAEDEERILRAAALVHDVTHLPSGHDIEDARGILPRHDSRERYLQALGPESDLGAQLERMGIRREVLAVLLAEGEDDGAPGFPRVPPCWRELLSDTICADLLDYLKRDAWFTGLQLHYDERVISYFMVDRESGHLFVDVEKRGLLREDILSELLRVLDARYFFSERVYYHHAKVAAGAMIAQAVEAALRHAGLAFEELRDATDASLIERLRTRLAPGDDERARAGRLLRDLGTRRLLKRACVFPLYANREVQDELLARFFAPGRHEERRRFEEEVRAELARSRLEPVEILLYCPARRMQLKEAATHVRFPGAGRVQPLSAFAERIPRLADLERSYRDLWKLYVFASTDEPKLLARIAEIVARLLPAATNVYRPNA